jgi:hypothetical protein
VIRALRRHLTHRSPPHAQAAFTDAEVARYHRAGCRVPIDILTPAEAAAARADLEVSCEARSGGPIRGDLRHKPHLDLPWLNDLVRHPRILDAVEDVLGPNLFCWLTTYFIKEPRQRRLRLLAPGRHLLGPLLARRHHRAGSALSPANLEKRLHRSPVPGTRAPARSPTADTFHDKDNLLSRGQEIARRGRSTARASTACSTPARPWRCATCCSSTAQAPNPHRPTAASGSPSATSRPP